MNDGRRRIAMVAVALLVGAAGCGKGTGNGGPTTIVSGLAGMYMTTAHTTSMPCGAAGDPQAIDPTYFQVADVNASQGSYVAVYRCTGADPATCDKTQNALVGAGVEQDDGSFLSEVIGTSGTPDCVATWFGSTLRASTGGATVTQEVRSGNWTAAQCSGGTSTQIAMGRLLACQSDEVWVGLKI
jgi:hypothetical protein